MKLPEKPWVLVRWSAVALIYAGTIAVAVDQVKTRDAEIAKLEQRGNSLKKSSLAGAAEQRRLTLRCQEYEEKLQRVRELADQLKAAGDTAIEAYKNEVALLKASNEVRKTINAQLLSSPAPTISQQATTVATAPVYRATDPAENPIWKSYSGTRILQEIKASANNQWGTDYRMVEFEVKRQKEAYEQFLDYNKSYNKVTKTIVANAVQQWGNDYRMTVYEIKRQLEAKQRIDGK